MQRLMVTLMTAMLKRYKTHPSLGTLTCCAGSDVSSVCRQAAFSTLAIRSKLNYVTNDDAGSTKC